MGRRAVKEYPLTNLFIGECESYPDIIKGVEVRYKRLDMFLLESTDFSGEVKLRAKKLTGRDAGKVVELVPDGPFGVFVANIKSKVGRTRCVNQFAISQYRALSNNPRRWNSFMPEVRLAYFVDQDQLEDFIAKANLSARSYAVKREWIKKEKKDLLNAEFER